MLLPPSFLLETGLRVSLLILLLALARPWLRRRVGSAALATFGLLLAAALLLPVPIRVPWRFSAGLPAPVRTLAQPFAFRVSVAPAARPAAPPLGARSAPSILRPTWVFPWRALWLAGVFLAASRLVRGWLLTRRWAARTHPADSHARLLAGYGDLPASLRRGVTLRLTDDLAIPTLAGLVRPQIWFPRSLLDTLTPEEIRHVLLHELGHARRRDLLAQWFCSLACCVHWFNPLVWLLARFARTDRELACDAWVLARLSTDAASPGFPAAYGHTLLKMVAALRVVASAPSPALISMATGRHQLGLRIGEIGAFRPRPWWQAPAALAMPVVLTAGWVVARAEPTPAPATPPVDYPVTVAPAVPAASPTPTPLVTPAPENDPLFQATPRADALPAALVHFEAHVLALSKEAVLRLRDQGGTPALPADLVNQLAAVFDAPPSAAASPARFALSRILPADFPGAFLHRLNGQTGVDLLSAPQVTTKSDQKATVEIIREFLYPTRFIRTDLPGIKPVLTPDKFEKKNLGLTLAFSPVVSPSRDAIDATVSWRMTDLQGYVRTSDGEPVASDAARDQGDCRPVFSTQEIETVVTMPPGSTLLLCSSPRSVDAWRAPEVFGSSGTVHGEGILLNLMSVNIVEPEGRRVPPALLYPTPTPAATGGKPGGTSPAPTPTPTPLAPGIWPAASLLPYAVPVPGRAGFATSPYAPDAGYVDLHGYKRGESVRDPYTGKLFLVP